jgi:molybdopterin synthase sulfur carrier subunit
MNHAIKILYFAWLRERTGTSEEDFLLPDNVTTVGDLIAHLRTRSPAIDAAFASPLVRAAVNQDFASAATPVAPGDEVAFFPPVTGG